MVGIAIGVGVGPFNAGGGGGEASVWLGMGQNMRQYENTLTGGANRATLHRARMYSPVAFRRCRFIYAVYRPLGNNPMVDTLLTGQIRFQGGFLYPAVDAYTSLPPRDPIMLGGDTSQQFDSATWNPASGHIVSDIFDAGETIPARTAFEVWTALELPAGVYSNALPTGGDGSNFIERYQGTEYFTTAITQAGGAGSDLCLTATSISALTTTQTSGGKVLTPVAMLIETAAGTKCIGIVGDSKGKGVGEGQAVSGAYGDASGDAFGNRAIFERGLWANTTGTLWFNVAEASDGHFSQYLANNFKYRLELLDLCAPTDIIDGYGHNDISKVASPPNYSNSLAMLKGQTLRITSNNNIYRVTNDSGSTAASGTGPTGTGTGIVDGTLTFDYIGSSADANVRRALLILGRAITTHDLIRTVLPTVNFVGFAAEPGATLDSGGGADPATQQTVLPGNGDSTSLRSKWNDIVRSNDIRLFQTDYIESNVYVEYTYPTVSSKWDQAGVANRLTGDGVHQNSFGYSVSQAAVTADKFT